MLDSTFSLVGEGLRPSATYIVFTYSQMPAYRWLKQTNISETNSISVQIWFNTLPPQIIYLHKARV